MRRRIDGWWVGGTAAGLALTGLLTTHWRVPARAGGIGADVRVVAVPTGELGVSPVGDVLTATALVPGGDGVSGTLTVRNQTARRLAVSIELRPSSAELDDVLEVRFVTAGATTGARKLRLLQHEQPPVLHLAPAEEGNVTVVVRVARDATSYAGRSADLTLGLVSRVAP